MSTMIKERVETAARAVTPANDGFERIGASSSLVMSTPATITVTVLFVTQWSTAFTGGADRASVGKSLGEGETTPSLEDLIKLHD